LTRGLRRRLTSYGDEEFSLFLRKAFIKAMGYSDDALDRPIVGIANTYSDYNPCHGNVPQLIEAAKRGVMLAGGMPMVFPTISIHESFAAPTSMFLRNLMAMETEEMVRAQPMDSVILIGGCDKTIPAQMMAAASSEVPAIILPTGPMETGHHRGERLGACTDCRRIWGQHRAGAIDGEEIGEINGRLVSSVGTCTVMGTASTMACLVEAMGLALPMSGSAPATSAERVRIAEETGRAAVAMAHDGLTTAEVLTPSALRNGLAVLQALGGSTNAVVHLAAVYGRLGSKLDLAELDKLGREVPVLVDLKPSGVAYMGEFHAAGGVPRLLSEIADMVDLSTPRAFGGTIGDAVTRLPARHEDRIIRRLDNPVSQAGAIAVLSGNLAPRGAVIKHSAASPALQVHEGRAVVFDSVEDMTLRLDDDQTLAIAADDVLVLRNAGPKGAPGMPEAGYIPIPRHLARQGVKDMVRISDARMSGTAFGTVILHVTPEAADGGPLAAVRTGDRIRLDVPNRRIEVLLPPEELAARMSALEPLPPTERRGYARLYHEHVLQADDGADFDFLQDGADG